MMNNLKINDEQVVSDKWEQKKKIKFDQLFVLFIHIYKPQNNPQHLISCSNSPPILSPLHSLSLTISLSIRLLLLSKSMMNLKLQNMKEAAYFDYFKSFSLNASDTIKKLEIQFKEQIEESFFLDPSMMFKRIKTLLGSYEILIYEINDSCEFVQIPQFGNCLLKIFLQIMSLIRFLLHKILQKNTKKQDSLIDKTHSTQKNHLHMTHTHLSHTLSLHEQNRLIYKKKQQSKYIINTINQQLSLLELEQSQNLEASKKQLRSLIEGKQKLQSIEISQNQNILSETLNTFCKKGEHLKNFVNVRQAAMISNMKEGVGEYMKVKDIFDQDSNTKLSNASIKLQELFKTHTLNYLKEKQSEMLSLSVQVHIEEPLENRILEENKHIKRLNDMIRKLNDQMSFEQQKNVSLENLLKAKNEEYELRAMEFRVAKIDMDNLKAKHEKIVEAELNMLNSKHDLCSNCHTKMPSSLGFKKSEIDCISRSIIEASQENERINTEQSSRKSDSALPNASRLMQKLSRKHNKNSSSVTRKNLAFKQLNTKSDELKIDSVTWEMVIQPEVQVKNQAPSKKRTMLQRLPSTNSNLNNTFSSYKDHNTRSKTKVLGEGKIVWEVERVLSFTYNYGSKMGTNNEKGEQKLIEVKGLNKKFTEPSCQDQNEPIPKNFTEKWIANDPIQQFTNNEPHQPQKQKNFCRNNLQIEIVEFKSHVVDSNEKNTLDISSKGKQKDSNKPKSLLKQPVSKSQNANNPASEHQELCNSASRLSYNTNCPRYPKFIKFSSHQRISLAVKDLINLFFDVQTAKNFQYINLFQNDQLRVGTASKDARKSNQALSANIKQLQKKSFINGLITRVKGEVASRNMNMKSPQRIQTAKGDKHSVVNECQTMSGTFSSTMMKTQFWTNFSAQKQVQNQCQNLKTYDAQTLVAMLFKQLKYLKRASYPTNLAMTNYQMIRNFLRYPYSAITLQNDKKFIEKQRQESAIEYLELRKIMHRLFKVHKGCKIGEGKNTFEKLGMKNLSNPDHLQLQHSDNVLCCHLVDFFQTVGILLMSKNHPDHHQN